MNNKVNWQEVFNGPERPFTRAEKNASHWGLWPCSVYYPQLAEKLEYKYAEGSENELQERSLDFCESIYDDDFKAAKKDHDFIRDWKPQWNTHFQVC